MGSLSGVKDCRVSVIVPTYNEETRISRALESVFAQSFPPFEVIVVDDGSTDGTSRVLQQYGQRVRYLYQENSGSAAARNFGIRNAQGDYVAFLDADDQWMPNHLMNAMDVFIRHRDLKWFCGAFEKRLETGALLHRRVCDNLIVDDSYFEDYFQAQLKWGIACSSTMIIKREVFETIGYFNTALRCGEDAEMWFRIAVRYPKIGYCSEVSAIYWSHEGTVSRTLSGRPATMLSGIKHLWEISQVDAISSSRSRPLLIKWLTEVIKAALRDGNTEVLNQIHAEFSRDVPWKWKLLVLLRVTLSGQFWRNLMKRNRPAVKSLHGDSGDTNRS